MLEQIGEKLTEFRLRFLRLGLALVESLLNIRITFAMISSLDDGTGKLTQTTLNFSEGSNSAEMEELR